MDWEIIPRDEQETIVEIDYYEKKIDLYTTRKSVAKRLEKKIGKPDDVSMIDNKIASVTYRRNLFDKDIKAFLSVSTLVGGFRQNNNQDEELVEEED